MRSRTCWTPRPRLSLRQSRSSRQCWASAANGMPASRRRSRTFAIFLTPLPSVPSLHGEGDGNGARGVLPLWPRAGASSAAQIWATASLTRWRRTIGRRCFSKATILTRRTFFLPRLERTDAEMAGRVGQPAGSVSVWRAGSVPHSRWNTRLLISMLSRGSTSAGAVGSSKAVCGAKRARPSVRESKHLSSSASFGCISGT